MREIPDAEQDGIREAHCRSRKKAIVKKFKTRYNVFIGGDSYGTSAYGTDGAISNASFQYAKNNNEAVALVRWKINNGELFCHIEEEKSLHGGR
jgi:hypothetical protein